MQQKKHFMYLINDIYEAKNTAILAFISVRYPEWLKLTSQQKCPFPASNQHKSKIPEKNTQEAFQKWTLSMGFEEIHHY